MVAYVPPKQVGKYKAVASGAITNGKPVIVNSTGTVSQVSGNATSAGTKVVFEASTFNPLNTSATFDSNSNKIVIAYKDSNNSNYSTAIVGTIDSSDNSISFGSPVVFNSGSASFMTPSFDSSNNKVLIVYRHQEQPLYAIVGTVSGTSISFGSAVNSGSGAASDISSTFDTNSNKTVITFEDGGSAGKAIVATISGTSVSLGTAVTFESAEIQDTNAVFDSSNNKVVIAYKDVGNSSYGTAIVGTVSGTSISFGTAVVFASTNSSANSIVFDSNLNKVIISFIDSTAAKIKSVVGTVSGTGISFGSITELTGGESSKISSAFDSSANKVLVARRDSTDSNKGKVHTGTVSGTSISFETPVVFNTAVTEMGYSRAMVFDSNSNRSVVIYNDHESSNQYGTASVLQASSTNITSEGYIGIASGGTYADTAEATIDVVGTVNKDQTSLTAGQTYYVQNDGTLGTSADSPSVVAGTAISATEIIVKT